MTKEQAIRILSAETSMAAVEELKYYAGFNADQVIDQIQEAMNMGAEALAKQIPKKVISEKGEIFDCDREGNELRFVFNFCPSCKIRFIRYGMKHCGECGQAIDWKVNDNVGKEV